MCPQYIIFINLASIVLDISSSTSVIDIRVSNTLRSQMQLITTSYTHVVMGNFLRSGITARPPWSLSNPDAATNITTPALDENRGESAMSVTGFVFVMTVN
jgi:hypothetical protein